MPSDLNRGTFGTTIRESFGQEHGLVPSEKGIVHYGVVRIQNNFLAVLLRNRAGQGRVNQFSRVILAPRNKTRGRINVNTVVTHRLDSGAFTVSELTSRAEAAAGAADRVGSALTGRAVGLADTAATVARLVVTAGAAAFTADRIDPAFGVGAIGLADTAA